MHATEWFFVCHIIHKNKAHGSSVIGCCDGAIPFLASGVLESRIIKINLFNQQDWILFSQTMPIYLINRPANQKNSIKPQETLRNPKGTPWNTKEPQVTLRTLQNPKESKEFLEILRNSQEP